MKIKIIKHNKAVSELLGTILLLVISVTVFSVVYASLFSAQANPSTPSVNLVGTIKSNNLLIEHFGGKSLSLRTKVLIDFNEESIDNIMLIIGNDNYLSDEAKADKRWDIGEKFLFSLDGIPGFIRYNPIDVLVIDVESNSIVMDGTVQEIIQGQSYSDLGVYYFTCLPSTVSDTGSIITASFSVFNYHEKPSNGFEYSIKIDGTEVVYKSYNLNPALESGIESNIISETITLPDSQPLNGNDYEISLEILIQGTIYEDDGDVNLGNNYQNFYVTLNQIDPDADLEVNLFSSNYNPLIDEEITVTAEVKNNGPSETNNVNVRCNLAVGLAYQSHTQDKGDYDKDTGIWNIGYLDNNEVVQLNILCKIEIIPNDVEFTQLAVIIDGSDSIPEAEFQMMINGLANSVRYGEIPYAGKIELTVFQIGIDSPYPFPYHPSNLEIGPVVLTDIIGDPGYYQNVADEIGNIEKIGGFSPIAQTMKTVADTLKVSPYFEPSVHQAVNIITDGFVNLKPFQKHPPYLECVEVNGEIYCMDMDETNSDEPVQEYLQDLTIYRDYMVSQLQMTEDQDEINALIIDGQYGNNFEWFKDNFVWPEPCYENWPPTGLGWIRLIDNSNEIQSSLKYQINIDPGNIDIGLMITNSDHPDPNSGNNQDKIVISPL